MNKRQRKKLHRGEFQELGFECQIKLTDKQEATVDQFIDNFIAFVAKQGLRIGDRGSDDWTLVIAKRDGGSTSSEDRQATLQWLRQQQEIAEANVSQHFDIWYPPKTIPYDT